MWQILAFWRAVARASDTWGDNGVDGWGRDGLTRTNCGDMHSRTIEQALFSYCSLVTIPGDQKVLCMLETTPSCDD
jgi:hypothetical protein